MMNEIMPYSDDIRQYFDRLAPEYETIINRLVPYYQKQNSLMMDLIPLERRAAFKALDLGAATGILSRILLDTFPNATVKAVDISSVMLDLSKKKLWAYPNRASFQQVDFLTGDYGGGYDVVFAGLVLHHTDEAGRRTFFKRILSKMNAGGILLCRDIVRGATANLTQEYEKLWNLYMRAQGEDSQLWSGKFQAKDPLSTVSDQQKWMRESGFIDVGCHWRYLNFALTGGRKPQ